jgi:hypothetical protein
MSDTPRTDEAKPWCPDRCPITNRPFFMWIERPSGEMVPTYGGPFDSYTIPVPDSCDSVDVRDREHVELYCERYDHDEGAWVDGVEIVQERIVRDEFVYEMEKSKVGREEAVTTIFSLVEERDALRAEVLGLTTKLGEVTSVSEMRLQQRERLADENAKLKADSARWERAAEERAKQRDNAWIDRGNLRMWIIRNLPADKVIEVFRAMKGES